MEMPLDPRHFYIDLGMAYRREFLKKGVAIITGSMLANHLYAAPLRYSAPLRNIGVQLFSIPKLADEDFVGTMRMVAGLGYKEIEFFGPYPFSPQGEKDRWNAITPSLGFSGSGFFGLSAMKVKKILDENGLSTPSMHSGLPTLENNMGQLAEAAHLLGAKYVVLPSAETQATLDAYKSQADRFNKIGAEAKKHGVRFAYHNHGNGLKELDGAVPFDLIMKNTDPKSVFFQMDVYWMTAGGVDILDYLKKYKGRFRLMHVKDMAKPVRFSGDGGDSDQWISLFPFLEDAGSGVIDLKAIIPAAKKSGVEHFIVERDLAPQPEVNLRKSFEFLSGLK
jgi:sugar phosphate isomerase/epimerase